MEQELAFSLVRNDHELQFCCPVQSLFPETLELFSLTSSHAFALAKPELFLEDYWPTF